MAIQRPKLPPNWQAGLSPQMVSWLALFELYVASLESRIKALEP